MRQRQRDLRDLRSSCACKQNHPCLDSLVTLANNYSFQLRPVWAGLLPLGTELILTDTLIHNICRMIKTIKEIGQRRKMTWFLLQRNSQLNCVQLGNGLLSIYFVPRSAWGTGWVIPEYTALISLDLPARPRVCLLVLCNGAVLWLSGTRKVSLFSWKWSAKSKERRNIWRFGEYGLSVQLF